MTKQVINVGAAANDGTGDDLRSAGIKINSNFTEVYGYANDIGRLETRVGGVESSIANFNAINDLSDLTDTTGLLVSDVSDLTDTGNLLFSKDYNDLLNKPTIPDLENVTTSIVPATDVGQDLGTLTKRWRDLYLSGNTIYIGDGVITTKPNGDIIIPSVDQLGDIYTKGWRPTTVTTFSQQIEWGAGVLIDQATFLQAQTGDGTSWAYPDFNPSTYAIVLQQNVANPALYDLLGAGVVESNVYTSVDAQVNTDNMVLLPTGTDHTDPAAIYNIVSTGTAGVDFILIAAAVNSEEINTADIKTVGGVTASTVSASNIDGNLLYNPGTAAVWADPVPDTVGEAIDRLADAIFALNGGTQI